jgi:hypothetical protein
MDSLGRVAFKGMSQTGAFFLVVNLSPQRFYPRSSWVKLDSVNVTVKAMTLFSTALNRMSGATWVQQVINVSFMVR